jgi:hypothetical protein
VADQSASNPVTMSWAAGAGQESSEYFLVVGTSSGAADAGVIPMNGLKALTAAAPAGVQLFVRVAGRNAAGLAISNEVRLRASTQAPAPPAAPAMLAPTVTGTTVRLSWQPQGTTTGFTVVARNTSAGAVIASIPVAAGATGLTIGGVARGTYFVSVVAHNGTATSAESAVVAVTVK